MTPSQPETSFSTLDLRDRVSIMLLFQEVVREDDLTRAHAVQKQDSKKRSEPLWRVLAEDASLDRAAIFAAAAEVYGFDTLQLSVEAALTFVQTYRESLAPEHWDLLASHGVIPAPGEDGRTLVLATHDPTRSSVRELPARLGLEHCEIRYAPEALVTQVLQATFPKRNEYLERVQDETMAYDFGPSYQEDQGGLVDEEALEAEIGRSSLINLFEAMLVEGVRQGASDIHLFPNPRKHIEIHFRVDGQLDLWKEQERVRPEAFLAVVKDNCTNVDRFERDTAQDGFIQRWIDGALIRFRVSVLPIATTAQEIRAESVVIRILDDRKVIDNIEQLGLAERALKSFHWALRQPNGMVVLTGPTGSGKSTTLFAALKTVVTPKVNALTVEDPVEYIIPGVRQIKLNHKLGLEGALRAILRHDPDIVMLGEMRDRETAETAIKLANTGHLTFSTLHTNDAPSAVSRLYKMGIEPFLIAYAINLVVAQRLIRTLCTACKRPDTDPDADLLLDLGFTEADLADADFYQPNLGGNCPTCGGSGYKGRRAITEAMVFSKDIRKIIARSKGDLDEDVLRDQAVAEGMTTLLDSARALVRQGVTSPEELMRVVAT